MLVKIYAILWAVIAAFAILLLVTGNFSMLTLVGFGFVSFGMIFMGMMGVLPSTYAHRHDEPAPKKIKIKTVREESAGFHPSTLATR